MQHNFSPHSEKFLHVHHESADVCRCTLLHFKTYKMNAYYKQTRHKVLKDVKIVLLPANICNPSVLESL